jgi:type II secretory pathway pseudopilin PulG
MCVKSCGFSLLEVLSVVAIMVLLFGILTTVYFSTIRQGSEAQGLQSIRQVATAIVMYREQNDDWPHQSLDAITYGQSAGLKELMVTKLDQFKPAFQQWCDATCGCDWHSKVPTTYIHPFRRFPSVNGRDFSMYERLLLSYENPAILADRSIGSVDKRAVEIKFCDGALTGPYHRVGTDTSVRRMQSSFRLLNGNTTHIPWESFYVDDWPNYGIGMPTP